MKRLVRHPTDGRVHFSELKAFSRSPAHYKHACEHARDRTRAMTVGAVTDCMVFGNDGWIRYPYRRDGERWVEFQKRHPGKIICIDTEYDDAVGAAEAVRTDPLAMHLLDGCEYQVAVQWSAFGLDCAAGIKGERGGFDAIKSGSHLVDLKITSDVQPASLMRHAFRQYWHCQAAWYMVASVCLDYKVSDFYLICVEAQAPHVVTVLKLPEKVLEMGRKQIRLWVERLRACDEEGVFPGYVQSIQTMELPEWMGDGSDND